MIHAYTNKTASFKCPSSGYFGKPQKNQEQTYNNLYFPCNRILFGVEMTYTEIFVARHIKSKIPP
jgi:hypothetical protein